MSKNNDINKLKIINQAIKDTEYITTEYSPYRGIISVFCKWLICYSSMMLLIYVIDILNFKFGFYNYKYFYNLYNGGKVIFNICINLYIWKTICLKELSVKERRFLKLWIIFPILFSIEIIIPILTNYLNTDAMISFYQTISLSYIIVLIELFYIYSYFRNKRTMIITLLFICYIVVSFILKAYIYSSRAISNSFGVFMNIFYDFDTYGLVAIIMLFTIIFLKRDTDDKRKRNL